MNSVKKRFNPAGNPPLGPKRRYHNSMEKITLTHVHDLLDELGWANGFWAGELSMMGCAALFDLEISDEEVEDVTAVLFDDEYGDLELALVGEALEAREADPETLTWGELVQVAERYDADPKVLSAELAELVGE